MNGGYVRDLLIGKQPDDLDISLCLIKCDDDVGVVTVLEMLEQYWREAPEYQVTGVKSATILSNESKNKKIDTVREPPALASAPSFAGSPTVTNRVV